MQTRLIRAVGRAELSGLGPVFVKVMGFPRAKDRLRYAFRALPAVHEAALLGRLARARIACPAVVDSRARRRFGLPWSSMLVTREVARAGGPEPRLAELAALAAKLADLGVFHPDLTRDNFVPRAAGGLAVLDLQSARDRGRPLGRRDRLRMAAKLYLECAAGAAPEPLADAGLIDRGDLPELAELSERIQRAELVRRVGRCFRVSTEFDRAWRPTGRVYRLRAAPAGGAWVRGGRELVRMWVGQRVLAVLDGRPPILCALFKKCWWLPGTCAVYIPGPHPHDALRAHGPVLLEAEARFRRFSRGAGHMNGNDALPSSGSD